MSKVETTLTIHKRNGSTYTATICGTTMRTAATGDTVIDLANPTSDNAAIEDIWHAHIAPALRKQLSGAGVSNINDIILYWVDDRRTWLVISDPADIQAIVPHIKEAMRLRKAEWDLKREIEARTVSITLTTCGWGDYGVCKWSGDIMRDDAEIIAECRAAIKSAHDTPARSIFTRRIRRARRRNMPTARCAIVAAVGCASALSCPSMARCCGSPAATAPGSNSSIPRASHG